jgi:putative toxin-antitoxin system antitoxin component (TIGR02293 family)
VSSPAKASLPGQLLGLNPQSSTELIRQLGKGFSFHTMQAFGSRSGVSLQQIASIIGTPPRTLARRKAAGRLSADESEKLLRLSAVFEKALEFFDGDREGALQWLSAPKRALENHTPLDYVRTEVGAREVENLLGRLEYGVFS